MLATLRGVNTVGTMFVVARDSGYGAKEGMYKVWQRCGNYDGQVRGGIRYTWCYLNPKSNRSGLFTLEEATKIFNKKLLGKEK